MPAIYSDGEGQNTGRECVAQLVEFSSGHGSFEVCILYLREDVQQIVMQTGPELKEGVGAGDTHLGNINIQMIFGATRPSEITKGECTDQEEVTGYIFLQKKFKYLYMKSMKISN